MRHITRKTGAIIFLLLFFRFGTNLPSSAGAFESERIANEQAAEGNGLSEFNNEKSGISGIDMDDLVPDTVVSSFYVDCMTLNPRGVFSHHELSRLSRLTVPGIISVSEIEQTMSNMMDTTRVSDVRWDLSEAPCGHLLTFHLTRSHYIRRLKFKGNHQIGDATLRRATDLRQFGPYSPDTMDEACVQFIRYYETQGFPPPSISICTADPDADGGVDITLTISEDPLPIPETLEFHISGHPGTWWKLRLNVLFKYLRWDGLRKGLNLINLKNRMKTEQRLMRDNGYRNADITVSTSSGNTGDRLRVLVEANVGKPVRIRFDNVGFLTRRDLIANWKRKHVTLDQAELDRLADLTLERLQNQGRLDAIVRSRIEDRDTVTLAHIDAEPGERYHVAEIIQNGISPISKNDLPRITGLYPPRLFRLLKTRPGPQNIEQAEKALKTHLDTQGYQRSGGHVSIDPDGEPGEPGVTVMVEPLPGPFVSIASIDFDGVEGIPVKKLKNLADKFSVSTGKPFVNRYLRDVMTAITRLYWEQGYSDMALRARTRQGETGMDITFVIDEGPAYRQGPLIIAGNVKTKSNLVYKLERIVPGSPFRLEKAGTLQEAMYQTGVFDTVTIRTRKYPEADPPYQTVIMDITERSTGEFETGIDYNSDRGFEGIVEIGERNLFGRALHGRISGLIGTDRWGAALSFQRPIFWGYRLENRFRANISDDRSNSGYNLQKIKLEIGAVRRWRNDVSLNVTYAYEREDLRNIDPDLADSIDIRSTRYGSLTPVLTIDKRDDPFRSISGWFYQTRFKSSLSTFGTQSEFFRWDHDIRYFLPIDGDRIVAGMALRGGRAWLLRDSIMPAGERFYLGGATTNRGFEHQMCGPIGNDGTPLGGLSYLLINLETRFHLAGNWKGAIFVDAGNVFSDQPESPWLRPSAGFGLRYSTAIGPIRGDIGWNLDRQPGESVYAIQIALGHAF